MKVRTKAFHEPQGLLYHGGAHIYSVGGYVLGLWGLFHDNGLINAVSFLNSF